MTSYMVEIDLPDNYTEEFEQRIPHQRFMVNKLMEKGTILSYSLAADKGKRSEEHTSELQSQR